MRGISGSGKSTYIQNNFPNAVVASADLFFQKNGSYQFNKEELSKAHEYSFKIFELAILTEKPLIVVDNTNTQRWEFKKYYDTAVTAGYEVEVIRLLCDPAVAAKRNLHNVSEEIVYKMEARFQPWPDEILVHQK